jgi:hypothetical protein
MQGSEIPEGLIAGLLVHDPRLMRVYTHSIHHIPLTSSFPAPTLAQAEPTTDKDGVLRSAMQYEPTSSLAQSNIWEAAAREELLRPQFKKPDLDYRRQKVRDSLRLINVTVLTPSSAYPVRNSGPSHRIIVYPSYSFNAPSRPQLP